MTEGSNDVKKNVVRDGDTLTEGTAVASSESPETEQTRIVSTVGKSLPMPMRAIFPFGASVRSWQRSFLWLLFGTLVVWFLWRVQSILPPFLISFFLAALLEPTVQWLRRYRKSRIQVILSIYLLGFLLLALAILLIVPTVRAQVDDFTQNSSRYMGSLQASVDSWMMQNKGLLRVVGIKQDTFRAVLNDQSGPVQKTINETLASVSQVIQGLASQAFWLIVIPIASFIFMNEYPVLRARIISLFPERMHDEIDTVSQGILDIFSSYIQGLARICSLYALVIFVILLLLGQKYALFFGLLAGVFYAIPLIGPWFIAILAAIISFTDAHTVFFFIQIAPANIPFTVVVLLAIVAMQVLFDQLLYPRVVGGSVGLHPVVSIFALMSGATLFGIVGMVVAVPVAGSIQILLTYFFPKLKESPPEKLLHINNGKPKPDTINTEETQG